MSFVKDLWDDATGQSGIDAAENATAAQLQAGREAIEEQRRASAEAQGYYAPYGGVGEKGVEASQFLANPQAQYDFLQSNPLFQMGLDNANQQTQASSAARGRLSAGDTLMQLNNNALLTASPLIDRQRSDVNSLMNYGLQVSSGQANAAIGQGNNVSGLMTDVGNVQAAGIGNAYNARQDSMMGGIGQQIGGALTGGIGGLLSGGIGNLFSDSRLKDNAEIIGKKNGYDVWKWTWNADAKKLFNLEGDSSGVMFSEVVKKNPEAVSYQDGYGKVNYAAIGV